MHIKEESTFKIGEIISIVPGIHITTYPIVNKDTDTIPGRNATKQGHWLPSRKTADLRTPCHVIINRCSFRYEWLAYFQSYLGEPVASLHSNLPCG